MTPTTFPAVRFFSGQHFNLAIPAVAGSVDISRLASEHQVSGKFVYQQKSREVEALKEIFALPWADAEVLFYFTVAKTWLRQVILATTFICQSFCRRAVEFMPDILGTSLCTKTVIVGVEAYSTYYHLIAAEEHRDAGTWAIHRLLARDQGSNLDYMVYH